MRDCPQDAIFHAEGDVWTHVGMVCQALASFEEFRTLPDMERQFLFAAALLHDVAKPLCTRHEDGRITSRGHSQRGAIMTRAFYGSPASISPPESRYAGWSDIISCHFISSTGRTLNEPFI